MAADCGGGVLPRVNASTQPAPAEPAAAAATADAATAAPPVSTSAFLTAAPCGPDGKPLPQSGVPR